MTLHKDFARSAAIENAPRDGVGAFVDLVENGDAVFTYTFESKLKGYRDWRWSVVIFAPSDQEPTVSEVLLMPGEGSIIAPDWVPWSERLADYRALQAELEAQAALEAEDSGDAEDDEDEDEESEDGQSADEANVSSNDGSDSADESDSSEADRLAVSDPNEPDDSQQKADSAGKRPKRLFGWRKPRVGKKNNK